MPRITEKLMTLDDVREMSDKLRLNVIEREIMLNLLDLAYKVGDRDGFRSCGKIFGVKDED